jgi:hypothetical protein
MSTDGAVPLMAPYHFRATGTKEKEASLSAGVRAERVEADAKEREEREGPSSKERR